MSGGRGPVSGIICPRTLVDSPCQAVRLQREGHRPLAWVWGRQEAAVLSSLCRSPKLCDLLWDSRSPFVNGRAAPRLSPTCWHQGGVQIEVVRP